MDEPLAELKQQRLAQVLLDFGRAPGKYPVRLGEPRELHAELDTLTVWAMGRLPKPLDAQAGPLREAAVLFIARACFAPEATHYQMFGLTPGACTPEALRARYRNLIRLTHPDMGVKGLPVNAAGAVNRAQGVLSDPDLRLRYDEELSDRKANAGAAERDRVARSPSVRKIEHRVSFAEYWQSLKARYPNLSRIAAVAGGFVVVCAGLLALALTSQNDERTLISARRIDRVPAWDADPPAPAPALASEPDPAPDSPTETLAAAVRKAMSSLSGNSAPSGAASGDAARSVAEAESRLPTGNSPGRPETPLPGPGKVNNGQISDKSRAPDIVIDPKARLSADSKMAAAEAARVVKAAPTVALRPSAAAEQPAPALVAAATPPAPPPPAESRRTEPPRPEAQAEAAPRQPPAPPPAVAAVAAPAPVPVAPQPAPPPPPAPPPQPRIATAPTPLSASQAPTPPAASTAARLESAVAVAPQVWNVDTTGAKHYLSELITMLETPNAAVRTNAYLTEMKVKGSLFRPALRIMRDFSEVDVSRVDWSDSVAPGVFKVRGTLVLHARSSQAPFMRTANFRLSAEFWGTPTGTVLAELSLREAE